MMHERAQKEHQEERQENIKKTTMNADRLSQTFLSSKMRQEAHAPA
jgi:hypothetical protein